MDRRTLISNTLVYLAGMHARTGRTVLEAISKAPPNSIDSGDWQNPQSSPGNAQTARSERSLNEIAERVFKREKEQAEIIGSYAPIVETYIQEEKSDVPMGTVPKKDLYFLGQADFHNKTMKVHPMTARTYKGSMMWAYDPAGFLQMAFVDRHEFDREHYRLTPPESRQREFRGEIRCYVFDVERTLKAKGPRFRGRIWVEDQDFTIVRMNGTYAPESSFSLRHFEDEFYEHFDSWRTNVRSGLWLPSDIYIQDLREPPPTGSPRFKARTHLWGYGLTSRNRREELGRLLVEGESQVKDDTEKQDRSPLEQQRGWRELSGNNVMDVLQRVGLVAPEGNVEKVLNTVVNNIMSIYNLAPGIEIKCRVLM